MEENTYNYKLSTVNVEKLRLRAYIGFYAWEKEELQDIVISFSFKYNAFLASQSDNVEHAVNYKTITKEIIKIVENKHFNLLETLAEILYNHVQCFSEFILDVKVRVEKPGALRFSDNVYVEIDGKERYNCAVIALGSNIDALANFAKALELLQKDGVIVRRTAFIKTKPLKLEEQEDFLNGAILFYTHKNLFDLKIALKQIEVFAGRVKSVNKNAPRQIDLDVITFNNLLIDKEIDKLPFLIDFVKELQPHINL